MNHVATLIWNEQTGQLEVRIGFDDGTGGLVVAIVPTVPPCAPTDE